MSSETPPATPPDRPPSFLDRQRWGQPHWLLIGMAVVFALAFVPRGVRLAIQSNVNKAEDWLPASYPESTDLRWFAEHFVGSQFVLVSWEGCTLGAGDDIARVVAKLKQETDDRGDPVFHKIRTGPAEVASLANAPSNLSRGLAVRRLEGALVGPLTAELNEDDDPALADASRTTCVVAYLSRHMTDNNRRMRAAIERVEEIVVQEIGVPADQVHLGGPPVDNVAIDIEGERTLLRLAGFSGLVGLGLSFWCFRSWKLTWFVFVVAAISAGVSLAIVYWYGVFELRGLGYLRKHLGTVDAILMSMPAVVYVLGLSGAIHIVNYYRDERDARGLHGAVERGVRIGWGPCALAALTTAVGLGSLGASDIVPIKKFGVFSAAGVLATVGVLLSILPVLLHKFPPRLPGDDAPDANSHRRRHRDQTSPLPAWAHAYSRFVARRHGLVAVACLAAMACFATGLSKIETEVRLLKLLDPRTDLITDYAWFEERLGNLVPMEVVVALSPDQLRRPNELKASDDGTRYRMTMFERMKLVQRIQRRVESLEPVSRAMSAATFGPASRPIRTPNERRATDAATSEGLEKSRASLAEYLATEDNAADASRGGAPRELWRISARVAALTDIDYGEFVGELQRQVEPVLDVYRLRDQLLAELNAAGKPLVGSKVAVVFDGDGPRPAPESDEAMLIELLTESGVKWTFGGRRGQIAAVNAAKLRDAADNADRYRETLANLDAVVTVTPEASAAVASLKADGVTLVSLAERGADTAYARSQRNAGLERDVSLAAVYTGVVPLVYKTQRALLSSLATSIGYATLLIAGVMIIVLRSPAGGLVSMIPNVFPIVSVFGTLGLLGVKVDIGIMMTASVALGVAVDDTIHFLTWFRRGIVQGLDRRSATLLAFDRCALAMTQTTIIAGLGLAVFATSTFTPTQQFGCLMITMLGAALVGDLVMLPALLCGPLGRFFAPGAAATPVEEATPATPIGEPAPTPPAPEPASPAPAETDETPPPEPEPVVSPPHATPPEPMSATNAALRSKLQQFRRPDARG